MAYTARKEADCKEFFDDPATLALKIKQLAHMVKQSSHFVAFTGAGISTAAGIADYRSGISTVLDTGAGKWAKQAAVKDGNQHKIKKPKRKKVSSFQAIPTLAHMSLVAMMTQGPKYLKYLISQNTDGLHRRSGIPVDQMSELHGNCTIEVCQKCGKEYMRDYKCRKSLRKQKSKDHFTGRYCCVPRCGGKLHDTIVNFGESLPHAPLEKAETNSVMCDLMLSLGSSLTVTPAADMPNEVGDKWREERENGERPRHNLCIVNLQKTPLDDVCSVRIFAKIDDVMVGLMRELGMDIPAWNLHRFVKIKLKNNENREDIRKCTVSGVDIDGIGATVFTKVNLRQNGQKIPKTKFHSSMKRFRPDEHVFSIPNSMEIELKEDETEPENQTNRDLVVDLVFYGHYEERNLRIQLNDYLSHLEETDGEIVLRMVFDVKEKKWFVAGKEQQMNDKDIGRLWKVFEK